MEFDEVREYVPGDDIRSIDWNVTARTGSAHIKKFVEEREMTAMLLVDVSASNQLGTRQLKRDFAAEIAAVLAFSAQRNNDRIGLILFADEVEKYIPPRKGTRHLLRLVREMLSYTPRGKGSQLAPALHYLNHIIPRKCVAFLISDFIFSDAYERAVKVTSRRHDLISFCLQDPLEMEWPDLGILRWLNPETGEGAWVDTSSKTVREKLARLQQDRQTRIGSLLQRAGVDQVNLVVGEPYELQLSRFFQQRLKRR